MEFMTPEERFTKIENLLLSLSENQVQIHADIQRHDGAIRDLILVNRSLVDSQQLLTTRIGEITNQISEMSRQIGQFDDKLTTGMEKLQEAQRTTEEKLNMLIETVDRIIRNREN